MIEVSKKLEFLNVHCRSNTINDPLSVFLDRVLTGIQLPSELCDCDFPRFQLTKEYVFESAAPDLGQLRDLIRGDLPVVQTQAGQVQIDVGVGVSGV